MKELYAEVGLAALPPKPQLQKGACRAAVLCTTASVLEKTGNTQVWGLGYRTTRRAFSGAGKREGLCNGLREKAGELTTLMV